jgi:hypothetical protein
MAWFTYQCDQHGIFRVSLPIRSKTVNCPQCQKASKAIIKSSTIQIVERLDNGAMHRAVERLHNVEEIMEERNQKHSVDNDENQE